MGALSGIPGFSPMQQRMLEDAIRQQEIYEQIERAMGGRAVLDFIESNREAIKLVESHSVEEQRVIEAARDLASGVTARREALKLATEIQQQHGLIADGSALELARKLSGVDALQDEIRRDSLLHRRTE